MYPVKLYTIDGVLIYQVENGDDNTGKSPLGGVIGTGFYASSMMSAIANPIVFYGGVSASERIVINQAGHSGDLYNYYWTSYSRGVDGRYNPSNPNWHNAYLDGYIPLRAKSIYDPCPYLYRIPSNGTYNQFTNAGWTNNSYLGGFNWNMNTLGESWLLGSGWRNRVTGALEWVGRSGYYRTTTASSNVGGYIIDFYSSSSSTTLNRNDLPRSHGFPVRCIEATLRNENQPTLFHYWWRNC